MSSSYRCCAIRALWILNSQNAVVFSRRFPVVEKRWRMTCAKADGSSESRGPSELHRSLPTDLELTSAISERQTKEGSVCGFGIRLSQSVKGSDSWVDDPIVRHIITIRISRNEREELSVWPVVLHAKGGYYVLVLPMVEPQQFKAYDRLCRRTDCGNSIRDEGSLSALLVNLPCITGAFMVAHVLGNIVTGDVVEADVVTSSSPSVGALLDSITGSMGISSISARSKSVAAPVTSAATGTSVSGSTATESTSKPIDKEALRTFISFSMPFGTPLELSYSNVSSIKISGFSSADLPPVELKQPAWKPYLYKGKQRILFTVSEIIDAAMYDRDDIPDAISVTGRLKCRAELEGLPDVSLPLSGLKEASIESLSFHHCVQASEHIDDKKSITFSPPLGNFVLLKYQALCGLVPPVKGFYQLSMVSQDEGAFLFRLSLMDGFKAPMSMEYCIVTMPFPLRRVGSFDGNPSIGTVSMTEHSIEWKIVTSGRGVTGKSIEATFSGTIKFLPWTSKKPSASGAVSRKIVEEDSDDEFETFNSSVNIEEQLMEKMNKDLEAVDLEEPFCWQAYNYARVSFKILGGTLSGMSLDPKSVTIYPAVKAPVDISMRASSGDYIFWNTLGRCPFAASPPNSQ